MDISLESQQLLENKFLGFSKNNSEKPVLYTMAGVPAAGKSTFVKMQKEKGVFPTDSFLLEVDAVMEALPEYHRDMKELGAKRAFETWEIATRDLAYDFFNKALSQKLDMVKDMCNAREENIDKIRELKENGYAIKVFFVHIDPEIAIKRSKQRERHTPESMIIERYDSINKLLPQLIEIADEFKCYDNSCDVNSFKEISKEKLLELTQ